MTASRATGRRSRPRRPEQRAPLASTGGQPPRHCPEQRPSTGSRPTASGPGPRRMLWCRRGAPRVGPTAGEADGTLPVVVRTPATARPRPACPRRRRPPPAPAGAPPQMGGRGRASEMQPRPPRRDAALSPSRRTPAGGSAGPTPKPARRACPGAPPPGPAPWPATPAGGT